MAVAIETYQNILQELNARHTRLIAVSKTKPGEDILQLYQLGQKDFGENYVQELVDKATKLPTDIQWHFIGHLQKNKVKYIAPFVYLIHGVDSLSLLAEINKQAQKCNRVIDCLLQIYIAKEETKFGLNAEELIEILSTVQSGIFSNIRLKGLMGMASFTENQSQIESEFQYLKHLFESCKKKYQKLSDFTILSMGMSNDYKIAIACGSNMVRIGSLLFGKRA
ncbi:MAG: YggS family pyridoxal phosphate-dependent enzyme [Hydrotalea flava]|uniref:YggS family pyridoxal phosphate-dependent enzyme n=1 Tax=Hydrotalea sp. AMD TaxID=2501297 RepID=UPI0009449E0E|nr:YggS family pyridoxal phosphate-dependent enzyme [Hydrotalea sp. AMD]NIM35342.1 YggS family pyridoxal phosphate-dependent enzyme [Hydrotalea flava]GHT98255.1 YggS family pyridoxal phosphate enzyme [Alphaproteobacteria bacterium]GHU81426.1 YggS family pyridoxal phosphate enzyme [Spirochaetia bacterium]NIM38201.1 YggS family pyridoxal phosphate-dependent enzyme [Hydrotalea flava]NIN03365.1 YggS family pyridoxal phosphate-dependent enzyme [Hydrotalea flava]